MSKKLLSMLLVLCMVLTMLPVSAMAVGGDPTSYDVWVGSTRVTSADAADVLGDGNVSYTPAAEGTPQTLTLNNASITTAHEVSSNKNGIYAIGNLNLVLEGDSIVGGVDLDSTGSSAGINVDGNLTISGGGNLTVTAGSTSGNYSFGINCESITINGSTVTANGGGSLSLSIGIFGKTSLLTAVRSPPMAEPLDTGVVACISKKTQEAC